MYILNKMYTIALYYYVIHIIKMLLYFFKIIKYLSISTNKS